MDRTIRIIKNSIICLGLILTIWVSLTIVDSIIGIFSGFFLYLITPLVLIGAIIILFILLSFPLVLIEQSKDRLRSQSKIFEKEISIQEDLENICPNCKKIIQDGAKFCVNCGITLKICKICNKILDINEEIAICPFCKTEFHKIEFLEYLKVKASCPTCNNEIDLWEFQNKSQN